MNLDLSACTSHRVSGRRLPLVRRQATSASRRSPGPQASARRRHGLFVCACSLAAGCALVACTGRAEAESTAPPPASARLLTALSAEVGSAGVTLSWEVDEQRDHRISGFSCVYRTPAHLRLGVAGAVPCGDDPTSARPASADAATAHLSSADARRRTVTGLPEYGDYLFELVAQTNEGPAIEWPLRALRVQVTVTLDQVGPAGPTHVVTGAGPMVTGCGPDDGPADASAERPWQLDEIVSAAHLTHYPGRGWTPGGDPDASPDWPEPVPLSELFNQSGLDGQVVQRALTGSGSGPGPADADSDDAADTGTGAANAADAAANAADDAADVAALLADERALVPLNRASAGTKALLRSGTPASGSSGGWELRLHSSYPFGADYVFAPHHAVPGWGDTERSASATQQQGDQSDTAGPADRPTAQTQLWHRTDCPPPGRPDASHDVALALSQDTGTGRRLRHSGYGWWAVAPVGLFPERIVATEAGLSFGEPAADLPAAPATYRGRASGHLFWDKQRYALAGDVTLTLAPTGDTAQLTGRIDNIAITPLDHESLQPYPEHPAPWHSLALEAAVPADGDWRGAVAVSQQPPAGEPAAERLLATPGPDAFTGDWLAAAYGPQADEVAGRLRLWSPLAPDANPGADWPAQALIVVGFGAATP